MKKLFINGNLIVNGSCSGKNIIAYAAVDNDDCIVINGNVTIDGNIELSDDQTIIVTGDVTCTE